MQLEDKHILITGASSGLGFSLVTLLSKKAKTVYAVARDKNKLETKISLLQSTSLVPIQCDVSNAQDVETKLSHLSIDIAINCAGVWIPGNIEDNSYEAISKAVDINVKGVIFVTKAVIPSMKNKKNGIIINISSTSGIVAKPLQSVYAATKYAVQGFTDSLAFDVLKDGIKVLGLYPGGMKTEFFNNAGDTKDTTTWIDPDKMAEVILFMIERDATMMMNKVVVSRGV